LLISYLGVVVTFAVNVEKSLQVSVLSNEHSTVQHNHVTGSATAKQTKYHK